MRHTTSCRIVCWLSLIAFAVAPMCAFAQRSELGKVNFPTTGSEQAKAHFLRGVAALHSFWYEEALEEFQEATKADPDFMMGYWGEAMTYNHPLWAQQDTEAARKAVSKIKDTPKLTDRERAYINAVKVLYGEGEKLARDFAYSAAMGNIYRAYPDDLEAAAFYALSLLGTVRPGDKGFRRQMQAGAIAMEVYKKNPDHPGAAHYIIHAFDDPEHAILALPAARRYSQIAPEAHHARHMPAHIFLQLGMWPEAAASNESAWEVSNAWVKRKNLPVGARDYHSLHWLLYVYLQQGRLAKAEDILSMKRRDVAQAPNDPTVTRGNDEMAAAFIIETERWDMADKLFARAEQAMATEIGPPGGAGAHAGHMPAAPTGNNPGAAGRYRQNPSLPVFVRGLAAAKAGSAEAEKSIASLQAIRKQMTDRGEAYQAKSVEILELEVAATYRAAKGGYDEAIAMMKKATSLEEEMSPPSGPPDLIKPSHELFGEVLLQASRPQEAANQFRVALLRQPNRARSLLGAARSAAQRGDTKGALEGYSRLLQVWVQADQQLPELKEAREYAEKERAN